MINFRNSPFLWITFVLLLSYFLGKGIAIEFPVWLFSGMTATCLICAIAVVMKYSPGKRLYSSWLLLLLIFLSGIIRLNAFLKENYQSGILSHSIYTQGVVQVTQLLKNKNSSVSLRCQRLVLFREDSSELEEMKDKFLLVYIRTVTPVTFLPGDIIRIEGWLSAIRGPLNPDAFDARAYYQSLGIRHQFYCNQENIRREGDAGFSIARLTAGWQYSLTNIIRQHTSPQVAQLTNALVWGDRSDMDSEVREAFADSGAMHVLSVSGMHVAIIYSMLLLILGPPSAGSFFQRTIRLILYSMAIILYMGLSGSCPAVVRAGLMILLYLFGKAMNWNTQIWNLLGFAAFVMLWINPYIINNIGFQLSFLAMAGILLYAKPFIRYVSFKNKMLHSAWEITVMSIVAQIFMLPILLSQFHQFPLTFIISSLAAVPAAYVIMAGAILNSSLSFLEIELLWKGLDWSGSLFIDVMQWMSQLNPVMHFSLPSLSTLLLMGMAVLFSFGLVFRWDAGRKLAWVLGIIALAVLGLHRVKAWTTKDLVIYHSTKGLMVDMIGGGYCYSLHGNEIAPASIEFMTRNYRCRRDIISARHIPASDVYENEWIEYNGAALRAKKEHLTLWNDTIPKTIFPKNTTLILTHEGNTDSLSQFIQENHPSLVIIPAHLDRRWRSDAGEILTALHIPYHDIDISGYYRKTL